ncbi:MAG: TolC family protein, partial [Candidatus Omnitrophica bacterium]|nr:TolC family protein [Candidatus Omnitrophota bacterium]
IEVALKNNVQLEIAQKQIQLSKLKVLEAKRNLGPKLQFKYDEFGGRVPVAEGAGHYWGRKLSVEYKQPLYYGGELWYGLKQAEVNINIVENDYQRIKNDVVLQVTKSYYGYDKSKKALDIQGQLLEEVSSLKDISQKGYEMGVIDNIEYLNVQSQQNQVNFQYISSEEDLALAQLILQQAMNTEDPVDIYPIGEARILDISLNTCYDLAYANRPEMKLNYFMTEYYLYDKKIADAKSMPKVDLLGNWGHKVENYYKQDEPANYLSHKFAPEWYAGIKVKVPMGGNEVGYTYTREVWQPTISSFVHGSEAWSSAFTFDLLNQFPVWNEQNEADVSFSRAQQEYNKVKKEITMEVKENYFKYRKAIVQLGVAQNKMEHQKKQVEYTVLQNELKEAPLSRLIEEMIKFSEEKFSMYQAIHDYFVAIESLNKAIGLLDYFDPHEKGALKG